MNRSVVIDIHAHPVRRSMVVDERNLRVMSDEAGSRLNDDPAGTLLARMAAGGIHISCLMGPNPFDGTSLTNDDVRAVVADHSGEFVGFVGVDPSGEGAAPTSALIRRAVREWGFKGVGEIGGGDYLAPEWDVVWQTCIDERVPVLVHAGIPLPSMLLRHSHPFLIDELAHRYPALRIIAAHAGVPWLIETISTAVRHENVYVDISTLPAVRRQLMPLVLALAAERRLEGRILFGSDFPIVDPAAYASAVRRASLPAPARWLLKLPRASRGLRSRVLGLNAAELLGLDVDAEGLSGGLERVRHHDG